MAMRKPASKNTTKKTAKKAAAPKAAKTAKKATKKVATGKTSSARKPLKKAVATKSAKASAGKAMVKPAKKTAPKRISPKQALANTLALLEAKNEKAKQAPSYPGGGDAHDHSNAPDTTAIERITTSVQPEAASHNFGHGEQGKRNQN